MLKRCKKCRSLCFLADFSKDKRSKDGHGNICRKCYNKTHIKLKSCAKNCDVIEKLLHRPRLSIAKKLNRIKKQVSADYKKHREKIRDLENIIRELKAKDTKKYNEYQRKWCTTKRDEEALVNLLKVKDIINKIILKGKTDGKKKRNQKNQMG